MKVGSAVLWNNGKAYFFDGTQYYRIDVPSKDIDPGYPKSISGNWPELWTSIDAALPWNQKAYFFKGAQYVRVSMAEKTIDSGYPKSIAQFWPGLWTTGIDAALTWKNYGYFFKGSQYMRVDMTTKAVDPGYPKSIAGNWPGLWTSGIEAAVTWDNGKAYFFKGSQYMRVDMTTKTVDAGYPKSIDANWNKTPDDVPLMVRTTRFHCHTETDDGPGSDEIYLVSGSVDIEPFIPRTIARSTRVMENFDEGDDDNDWAMIPWGIKESNGMAVAEKLLPEKTILLFCLMENDSSSVSAVRASVQAILTANAAGYKTSGYSRDQIAAKLTADMNGAIAVGGVSGGLFTDERIPGTQELKFSEAEVLSVRRGGVVLRELHCYGDGGHYSVFFQLSKP